jgi:hypothetical protein
MQPDLLVLCLTLLSGFVPYSDCSSSPSACAPVGAAVMRCVHELNAPDPSVIVQESNKTVAQSSPKPPPVVRKPVTTALGGKAPVAAPTPVPKRGTTPADAMEATDTWQEIGPKGQVWYKVGDPKLARVHFDVWLDAKGAGGIGFGIYAPDQMTDPISGPPKGQGTPNRKDGSHDLNWSGQAPAGGAWYIRVANSNPVPMQYKLGTNLVVTGERANCTGPYWEWIGAHVNAWVLWPGYCP